MEAAVAVAAAATRAARAVVARAMGWVVAAVVAVAVAMGWVAVAVVDTVGRLAVAEAWAVEVETMAVGLVG